jgi:hypothetical protein
VYEGYWGLSEKPFRKTPDPRFLFLNETYEEARGRRSSPGPSWTGSESASRWA